LKRGIERQDLVGILLLGEIDNGEQFASRRAPLGSTLGPGVVDQNAPHGFGGGGEEVSPVLELDPPILAYPQISLVHKSGRLEGVPGILGTQPLLGDGSQVVVEDFEQRIGPTGVGAWGDSARRLRPMIGVCGGSGHAKL
jgi:hypothetical protein